MSLPQQTRLPFALPGPLAAVPLLLVSVATLIGTLVVPPAVAKTTDPCAGSYNPIIRPADFQDRDGEPIEIDNPYFPLEPGTTFTYQGESEGDIERAVVKVTHDTRLILGVHTTVIRDRVTVNNVLHELAFDWYAQDKYGNVWYFGEDVFNYDEDGNFKDKAGSWEAGVNARPGIIMKARPKVGDAYRQEAAPGVAEDVARVLSLTKRISVPYGTFTNVLQTRDLSCFEDVDEHKYYARGVGAIKTVALVKGRERPDIEVLKLISVKSADDDDDDDEDDDDI